MFIVIGLMLAGVLVGFIFRGKKMLRISHIIMTLICLLLFLLGTEVGGNQQLIKSLHTIGIEAIIITIAALLGSVVGSKALWQWVNKKEKGM